MAELGFARDRGTPNRWKKAESVIETRLERLATGLSVLSLEPAREDPGARELRYQFLQVASHDVRGAIANARSYAALLVDRFPLEERAKRSLQAVVRNSDRALAHLRDFFEATQIVQGKVEPCPEPVRVGPLLRGVADRMSPLAGEHGVHLRTLVEDGLPELELDRELLDAAVAGFVEHAIARTPPGGTVVMEAHPRGQGLRVAVTDPSPPPSGYADGAFDCERQAVAEGKLGPRFRMALACDRVNLLGGEVASESGPRGTTFAFTLLPPRP